MDDNNLDFEPTDGSQEDFRDEHGSDELEPNNKPKKKKGKNKFIVLGVIAVFLVAGVGGGMVWHEEPTFCNAICHTPMDPYVDSYYNGTSVVAVQADANAKLSLTKHVEADASIDCLTCHIPTIGEQATEAVKWVTGDYSVPLPAMEYDGEAFCLRPECHEGITNKEELIEASNSTFAVSGKKVVRNPHDPHDATACSDCHKSHEQSYMKCTQCHSDSVVPEGWLTYKEKTAQDKLI